MNNIKPIETEYKGYRFRSRLEARWAVFFDSLGMKWQYEQEGFDIDGVWYLPDFYLVDSASFFEVKGVMTEKDTLKIMALIDTGHPVTIGFDDGKFISCDNWSEYYEIVDEGSSWLCQCNWCGNYWFMGSNGVYTCQCCGALDGDGHFAIEMYGDGHFDTAKLWDPARKARFEH